MYVIPKNIIVQCIAKRKLKVLGCSRAGSLGGNGCNLAGPLL